MKKILFSLLALVASMSMNAQVMKVMKNGEEVAKYNGAEYSVVFEEAPASTNTGSAKTTGSAKATIGGSKVDVNWVQLWENGPKFAEYNVGVTDCMAEDYGGYYCWGKTTDKDSSGTYKDGDSALTGDDDTATNLWGSNWRMPTRAELQALLDNCDVVWTTVNGVNGRKYTGRGDYASNSVFLPAAGDCLYGEVGGQGIHGYYWSSTYAGSHYACRLWFNPSDQVVNDYLLSYGYSVRAVLAE